MKLLNPETAPVIMHWSIDGSLIRFRLLKYIIIKGAARNIIIIIIKNVTAGIKEIIPEIAPDNKDTIIIILINWLLNIFPLL